MNNIPEFVATNKTLVDTRLNELLENGNNNTKLQRDASFSWGNAFLYGLGRYSG